LCFAAATALFALLMSWTLPVFAAPDTVIEALRTRIEQLRAGNDVVADGAKLAARTLIPQLYEKRAFEPVWDEARAATLRALVQESYTHGLDPNDYHAAAMQHAGPVREALTIANRDLMYTDALIRLVYHYHFGKVNPRELYADWNFARTLGAITPIEAVEALVSAPDLRSAVERYAPQLRVYQALRRALAEYRAIADAGGWPEIPAGPVLRPGMSDPRIPALRARLNALGKEGAATATSELYDDELVSRMQQFQAHHGLDTDGVLGAGTLKALNVPVEARIEQLRVNLERVRWVAQDIPDRFLLVDIAGFNARLYKDGVPVWSSRVVVGRPYRKTPVFRASIRYVVLNPDWTVPPTILREDVLPKVISNLDYLARNNMQVLDNTGRAIDPASIDWSRYRSARFPYQIVQAPGPDNSLGRIKFMFPNSYAVYLHDTPARALFQKSARTFSSGCIRVEHAHELGVALLDDAAQWGRAQLEAAIAEGSTRTVMLKQPLPVLLLYFTAEANAQGEVFFRPDVYDRDANVRKGLAASFRFSPLSDTATKR
jgi:murein L,D-transpeptidase YcbB/YkuD